ncbi:MAG: hypothetical protein COA99_11400 [Moraxellaceae bacterium]|nr:MAG: hypothetical protein COA99_11400 [Moraxellaceae bacterium]
MAKIINLDRDCTQAYLNFGNIIDTYPILIKNIAYASTIESAVSRFLARNDMRHDAMRDQINLIIDIDDATNEIESFVNTNDNDAFNFLKNSSRLLNILFRPCFLQYLQRATNVNITVEKLLTKTRKCLLNALFNLNTPDNTPITDQFSLLIAALAYQCFLNEYIFYVDPAEEAILVAFERQTKDKLEKHTSDALIYSALLVCYKQLMDSPDIAEKIMSYHALITPGLEGIIRLQISNPEKEKKIRNSIRQLKSIGNPTSQQVRQQYEENPYPRWSSAHYSTPIPIIDTIKNAIAPNKPVNLPDIKKPRILIAGCGTGRHPIDCAKAYKNSSILAIDLSLSSLSYAQRQADERGVNNIEFMQADILDLGKLNEQFDIIESCGVLHHMKEPLAGWKVLENLLKPGGLMKIGLYSELARAHIVTSRDIIAEQNFKSTPEGIRECRRFIQRMGDSDIFNSLLRSTDFFTTSMVRDLIFHSMEHRFSVPQIEDALTQLNLQFLGFCVSGDDTKKRYLQQFPADKTATSLTNWHIFEQQNPHYFQAMYQFWLRKSVM